MRNDKTGRFVKTRTIWTPEEWDNGFTDNKGRFRVYRPDYPRAYAEGYALRAHVVWWMETGEVHPPETELHHIDETKDNDRFKNLIPLNRSAHRIAHQSNWVYIKCKNCGKEFREHNWRTKQRDVKFCSQECYHKFPRAEEHKAAISNGLYKAHEVKLKWRG